MSKTMTTTKAHMIRIAASVLRALAGEMDALGRDTFTADELRALADAMDGGRA